MIISWRRVRPGDELPAGYGVAWRELASDRVVIMLVPLNQIARALRELWLAVRFPRWGRGDALSRAMLKSFERGRRQGQWEGMADAMRIERMNRLQAEVITELQQRLHRARVELLEHAPSQFE